MGAAYVAGSLAQDGSLAQSQQGASQRVRSAAAPGAAEAPQLRVERPGRVAARVAGQAAAQLSRSGRAACQCGMLWALRLPGSMPVRHAAGATIERSSVGLGGRHTTLASCKEALERQRGPGPARGLRALSACARGRMLGLGRSPQRSSEGFPPRAAVLVLGARSPSAGKAASAVHRRGGCKPCWAARWGVPVSPAVGSDRKCKLPTCMSVHACACGAGLLLTGTCVGSVGRRACAEHLQRLLWCPFMFNRPACVFWSGGALAYAFVAGPCLGLPTTRNGVSGGARVL